DNSSHSMEDMWLKFDKCKEDIAKEWDLIRENCLPDDFPSVHTKGKSLRKATRKQGAFLRCINNILNAVYGMNIVRVHKRKKLYQLAWPSNFDLEFRPLSSSSSSSASLNQQQENFIIPQVIPWYD
ncbi:MAG: hypothetical protein ACXV2C_03605, partial [Candidatus Bathyarchaeia archaeon]